MKKIFCLSLFILAVSYSGAYSQPSNDTIVYLLTCGPGSETYSIYGHSALRITISSKDADNVYNWGVFDFNTRNFAWKFAKGRLDYMLIAESLNGFLEGYRYEQRSVFSQQININPKETRRLVGFVNENLQPENVKYRYDFFYDDCSTRIRDLIEKSVGENLKYPLSETGVIPTFREMVGKYQVNYPWLKLGVDLIMGSTSDKKALFRDRMFLPIDMKNELSEAVVIRNGRMIPLLQNTITLLEFDSPDTKLNILVSPAFVFTFILIILIILSGLIKSLKVIRIIDIIVFSAYSLLSALLVFFNFFTDHQQMKWNLNIIWLNPFIIICLIYLLLNKSGIMLFRIVFFISAFFLAAHFVLPQKFNIVILLMAFIIMLRSSTRCAFKWNTLNLPSNL